MKRKLFFLMIVVGMVSAANAQWSIKPESGVMLINGKNNYKWNTRFTIGVGTEYQWNTGGLDLGLQSGLYYTQRGYENYVNHSSSRDYHYINRGFIQLPLKMNVYIPVNKDIRLVFGAGPYVAYSVDTSWGSSDGIYTGGYGNGYESRSTGAGSGGTNKPYTRPDILKWDYGVGATAGVEYKNIIVGVGYDMSFGKELKKQKAGLQYHNFTFTAAYRFKLGK